MAVASAAVLGAAAGTGLALVVAMTLLVCRYYSRRHQGKDWSRLDRFAGDATVHRSSRPRLLDETSSISSASTWGSRSSLRSGNGRKIRAPSFAIAQQWICERKRDIGGKKGGGPSQQPCGIPPWSEGPPADLPSPCKVEAERESSRDGGRGSSTEEEGVGERGVDVLASVVAALARGAGAASPWSAHRRLETWARAARERRRSQQQPSPGSPSHSPLSRTSSGGRRDSGTDGSGGSGGGGGSGDGSPALSLAGSLEGAPAVVVDAHPTLLRKASSASEEFNPTKEPHPVQPVGHHSVNHSVHHSYHHYNHHEQLLPLRSPLETGAFGSTAAVVETCTPPQRLCRTPSVSSQGSLEGVGGHPRQVRRHIPCIQPRGLPLKWKHCSRIATELSLSYCVVPDRKDSGHRGSSPQIRTFTPEGRSGVSNGHGPSSAITGPPSRSPSPTPDLSTSPSASARTPSPSAYAQPSPSAPSAHQRCLSPLLIPPPQASLPQPPRSPSAASTASSSSSAAAASLAAAAEASSTPPAPPASPLGALQPSLYARKDGPLFLGKPRRSGPSLGRLHLRLQYDFDRSDLHVHLIEAHDLAGSAQGGFNDPYVRLRLVPEVDSRKRQTTIHRGDPNPFFDEHFKFPVAHDQLQDKNLVLQVFDYDRYSRNDVVGEVCMSMEEFDVTSSIEVWGEITKNKKPPEERQEVLLSLSYLPSAERLTVVLLKARNLFPVQERDPPDPYAKVYLLIAGKRVKKKKTAARKACANPVWNEALTFNVPASSLNLAALEVCILGQSSDLIGANSPLLGSCVLGPHESPGPAQDHWSDMAQNPRKAVAMWHTLR
ncbi:uncharacterized protein LOC124162979 [Ischnura elegans]|uniref:uncharacterized protein LOC124162979 n=1 Tax=Ischnura elegans TaxID=197161 RepID=UPI001ED88E67|nr:uncharacterized protein LOC124162979 [Ischnura elegans]